MTRLLLLALISTASIFCSAASAQQTLGTIHRHDPRFNDLVSADAKIEVLASGFTWAEGPVWVPDDSGGHLLFSDIPRNAVFKWKDGAGISLFLCPSGYTGYVYYGLEPGSNGLLLDPQGRLVSCEHGDRRVSVLTEGGGKRTLVDNYNGKRLNSPNDGCYHENGDLYFTDPPYGLPNRYDDPRRELDFCGVYRLSKDGELTLLTKEVTRPNGIAFAPDFKTLYVAQSDPAAAVWWTFPVKDDGTLGEGKVLRDVTDMVGKLPGGCDGLKVDQSGNLFATGPGGVHVMAPDGTLLGRIETGQRTANVAWGNDGRTLYICADMHICRIQTKTKGAGWK
jgi:gluconolactonase